MSMSARPIREIAGTLADDSRPAADWKAASEELLRLKKKYHLPPEYYGVLMLADEREPIGPSFLAGELETGVQRFPNDADLLFFSGVAYVKAGYPALGREALSYFVERWPDHSEAEDAGSRVDSLDQLIPEIVRLVEVRWPDNRETILDMERGRMALEFGRFDEALEICRAVLEKHPAEVSARNNLSRALWELGRGTEAIEQQILSLEQGPARLTGLANLVRFLVLSDRTDEARQWVERISPTGVDPGMSIWLNAEMAAFLNDNERLIELSHELHESERMSERSNGEEVPPDVYLFFGTACYRTGDEETARRWWNRAQRRPGVSAEAEELLREAGRPESDRNRPWYFSIGRMMPAVIRNALFRALEAGTEEDLITGVRRVVEEQQQLSLMVPYMLDEGDVFSRYVGLRVAEIVGSERMIKSVLRLVASDSTRLDVKGRAGEVLSRQGSLTFPAEDVWPASRRQTDHSTESVQHLTFHQWEISFDPMGSIPEQVRELHDEAYQLIRSGDPGAAEKLLKTALTMEDDTPAVHQNLTAAYEQQGKRQEAWTNLERTHERFPDYSFARFGLAIREATEHKRHEKAMELIKPIRERTKLHVSEFTGLCHAMCMIMIAKPDLKAAASWYEMWRTVDPDDSRLERFGLLRMFGND